MTVYHVATTGSDQGPGSQTEPFCTIGRAADLAYPGDMIIVHSGEYREWVAPVRGGLSDTRRITYCAAAGEHPVIKGSERITSWAKETGSVWKVIVPNRLFGEFNPFAVPVEGDWVVREHENDPRKHLGDVYLNGTSFYEVLSRDDLNDPARRETVIDDRTGREVAVTDPEATVYVWYAEVGSEETTIWANFHGHDPNEELVEISVRRSVFYPRANHIDYITVRGFELAQAATPWAPPTADQPGLIGPNWAKGWIIEDNHIHHAKCAAISLGKEASTGDNYFTKRHDKPGYQYQLESVFSARHIGWSRERIGSHIVRRNAIHDCGQNGIVGHLGCVFSNITDNEIYNVAVKREFYGHEIGGIKLHAAIDVRIEHNYIHDCALGTWLDWQTQGTRITRNIYNENARDIYIEVSHGPYVVDHNIFASPAAIEIMSDGGAYVGNLILGTVLTKSVMERATPYHEPHSTEVSGYAVIYGGDDRFLKNVFKGNNADSSGTSGVYPKQDPAATVGYGTAIYDGHPASFEEYISQVEAGLPGDLAVFLKLKNPVYIRDNAYCAGARPYAGETGAVIVDGALHVGVQSAEDGVYLDIDLPVAVAECQTASVTAADLPKVRMTDLDFEEADGSPATLGTDLLGRVVSGDTGLGPIYALAAGPNRVKVWG
ncbi:right-handed parallel beta-helix repeat-containing protein [Propionimicrobium sp. PCR01-08-3]|uniref:right-handed parallel beta-helix repeat-containing protein n=1 Tax=Propionimicrobium sp. PCR01-08-3 TaxID=3052086 RepID=UPI00255CD523|nr:right-handed parallel beta-helix repeat-containing protein [Propionimicrobium sp. PCR01-08-3]WIY83365.1 right-handed parallel beta-helix repeat-containing protein [Propionimicrobium sp. PCR01-08-3]